MTPRTIGQKKYAIFDGLLSAKSRVLLKKYLTYNQDAWLFNNYENDDRNKQVFINACDENKSTILCFCDNDVWGLSKDCGSISWID